MSRVRLTNRNRRAVDDSIPYPGNVNQPDRTDRKWEEYHTFEQQTNHELPDMRHEWKDDERDEIGYGIPEQWGMKPNVPGGYNAPTVASVRMAANKAVRIAVLLLGDKVSDDVIEAQARDLMAVSGEAMDRTLARFAETQAIYAEDEKVEEKAEEKVEEKTAAAAETTSDKTIDKKISSGFEPETKPGAEALPENKKASEELADKAQKESDKDMKASIVAMVQEALKAALPDFIKEKQEEKKDDKATEKAKCGADEKKEDDEKKASFTLKDRDEDKKNKSKKSSDEEKKDEKDEKVAADEKDEKKDEKVAADEKKDEKVEEKVEEKVAASKRSTEMDIELSASVDEVEPDAEADAQLASIFDSDSVSAADRELAGREASQKAGIKKLGGQPRVASTSGAGATDISDIWASAPDVSEVFR